MEYIKEFSELTLQRINQPGEFYVYGLIDPRNNRLFYIKEPETEYFSMSLKAVKNQNRKKKSFKRLAI